MNIKDKLKKNSLFVKIWGKHVLHKNQSKFNLWKISHYYLSRIKRQAGFSKDSRRKQLSYIIWCYHVIEKGLSMANMRLGFGYDRLCDLINAISKYCMSFPDSKNDSEILFGVSVVFEYELVHQKREFILRSDITEKISDLHKMFPSINPHSPKEFNFENAFLNNESPFPLFAESRYSLRNFSTDNVELDDIIKAINLAKTSPSACNRQPAKVHIIQDKKLMDFCLSLQNGNRGFGNTANKLLIITGNVETILGVQEIFDLFTNCGIFIMNLSYSLQYFKIGHCILNWYAQPKDDKKIRKALALPDNEVIVCFIVCGKPPKEFSVADSLRLDTKDLYTIH